MADLFHFSEDPDIRVFAPRPVRVPAPRAAGMDWLNGPLVWAIDEAHACLYLFPRDCPRILIWARPESSADDRRAWLGDARIVAHIERRWAQALSTTTLYRYRLPPDSFAPLDDVGMHVSRQTVRPLAVEPLDNLPLRLTQAGVEIREHDTLTHLRHAWSTSLHASGLRLRNAAGW